MGPGVRCMGPGVHLMRAGAFFMGSGARFMRPAGLVPVTSRFMVDGRMKGPATALDRACAESPLAISA
jgi:hypothetical protein